MLDSRTHSLYVEVALSSVGSLGYPRGFDTDRLGSLSWRRHRRHQVYGSSLTYRLGSIFERVGT